MIFEEINARDLYRAFYNLNLRLNTILQSLRHLHLFLTYIRYRNDHHDPLFASRIETIFIHRNRFIYNLEQFLNTRHLIFLKSSTTKIEQIINQLPSIQHLVIRVSLKPLYSCDLFRRIFSNEFIHLKSCSFIHFQPLKYIDQWKQSPSIQDLRIKTSNSQIYASLLLACPNLHFLRLSIPTLDQTPYSQQINPNLRRLILVFTSIQWPSDLIFHNLFTCIPNLEELSIERLVMNVKVINRWGRSDYLANVITCHLPLLRQFKLTLRLCDKQNFESIDLERLNESFKKFHEQLYESLRITGFLAIVRTGNICFKCRSHPHLYKIIVNTMSDNLSQLEVLPNEILIDIFQYFDARDLFRSFYNLNSRFNALLQSLDNHFVTFSASDPDVINDSQLFSRCIHTMIIGREGNINLKNFPNLRRLKFLNPTCEQLDHLDAANLPYLEHLSVGYANSCNHYLDAYRKREHCAKVFTNGFPNLISCYLFHPETTRILTRASQLAQLRFLRVGSTSFFSYQTILSGCPNLYFFQFTFPCWGAKPPIIQSHVNLRRMAIDFLVNTSPLNDYDLEDYLSSVPNLAQLCMYRQNEDADMTPYLDYNWLADSIDRYLPLLRRFRYHFRIYLAAALIENDHENILNRLEKRFKHVHHDRYQSQLAFKLYPWPHID